MTDSDRLRPILDATPSFVAYSNLVSKIGNVLPCRISSDRMFLRRRHALHPT